MAGVLFVACIPTKEHERELNQSLNKEKKSSGRNVTISQKNDFDSNTDAEQVSLLADTIDSPDSDPETLLSPQDQCSLVVEKNKGTTSKKNAMDLLKDPSQAKNEDGGKKEKRKHSKLEILPDTSMEEVRMEQG